MWIVDSNNLNCPTNFRYECVPTILPFLTKCNLVYLIYFLVVVWYEFIGMYRFIQFLYIMNSTVIVEQYFYLKWYCFNVYFCIFCWNNCKLPFVACKWGIVYISVSLLSIIIRWMACYICYYCCYYQIMYVIWSSLLCKYFEWFRLLLISISDGRMYCDVLIMWSFMSWSSKSN